MAENDSKILKLINQIESVIAQLKLEIETERRRNGKKIKLQRPKKQRMDVATPIKNLLEKGFFSEGRTDKDVLKKLREQVLNPGRSSVAEVLRRFASPKKNLLERSGDGTRKNPWKYRAKSK